MVILPTMEIQHTGQVVSEAMLGMIPAVHQFRHRYTVTISPKRDCTDKYTN